MTDHDALLHHLFVQHADHVVTVRAPSMRVDGTGPTAGYLFCRDCDSDVDLSAPCPTCDPSIGEICGRPDSWDRLRAATITARAERKAFTEALVTMQTAWCHCTCEACANRVQHHPADCPVGCPWVLEWRDDP